MSILKKIAYTLLIVFVVLQFIRPTKNSSDTIAATDIRNHYNVPPDVENILKTACFDCHSNNTVYPWYTNIQPVGLWMQDHVNEAKKELDFSAFASYTPKKMDHKYEEIIEMVKEDEMPLFSYTVIHSDAKLTQQQKEILITWADGLKKELNYKK